MNEAFDEPKQTIFTTLQHGGPLYLLVVLLLLCLTLWHLWLSARSILRPAVILPASLHVIHLLSLPVIIFFYLLARISTSFPGLFINGIDADVSLKYGLQEAEFLGSSGLIAFFLTLVPALVAIHRANSKGQP
ncbi:MAG: hypothetical protein ACAI37_05660 [Chthoniobacter sp.]